MTTTSEELEAETLDGILDEELSSEAEFEDGRDAEGRQAAGGDANPQLAAIIASGFMTIANIICDRANVDAVTEKEAMAVGDTTTKLLSFYSFDTDPKMVAWGAALGSILIIVSPRVVQYKENTIEGEPVKPDIPDIPTGHQMKPDNVDIFGTSDAR